MHDFFLDDSLVAVAPVKHESESSVVIHSQKSVSSLSPSYTHGIFRQLFEQGLLSLDSLITPSFTGEKFFIKSVRRVLRLTPEEQKGILALASHSVSSEERGLFNALCRVEIPEKLASWHAEHIISLLDGNPGERWRTLANLLTPLLDSSGSKTVQGISSLATAFEIASGDPNWDEGHFVSYLNSYVALHFNPGHT